MGHNPVSQLSALCREGHHHECGGARRVRIASGVDWRTCHCSCHKR